MTTCVANCTTDAIPFNTYGQMNMTSFTAGKHFLKLWLGLLQMLITWQSQNCRNIPNITGYDMIRYKDDCLVFITIQKSFSDSMKFCEEISGHLTDVDKDSQKIMMNFTRQRSIGSEFWIGLVYVNALKTYIWHNGAKYTNNFKDDYVGNCVVLHTDHDSKTWENIKCNKQKPFICKIPRIIDKEDKRPDSALNSTTRSPIETNTTSTDFLNVTSVTTEDANLTTDDLNWTTDPYEPEIEPREMKDTNPEYLTSMILATIMALSIVINIFFCVKCAVCSRRLKVQQAVHHIDAATASDAPLDQSHRSSGPAKFGCLSSPRPIHQNSKNDRDASAPHERTAQDELGKSLAFPKRKKVSRTDSQRSELIMFTNDIYNADQSHYEDCNAIEMLKNMRLAPLSTSEPGTTSDNDSTYDLALSLSPTESSFKGRVDDAANHDDTALIDKLSDASVTSDQDPSVSSSKPKPEITPDEESDSILQFDDGELEFNEEDKEPEQVYVNA